jgi:hypothetical protein
MAGVAGSLNCVFDRKIGSSFSKLRQAGERIGDEFSDDKVFTDMARIGEAAILPGYFPRIRTIQ